MAEGGSDLTLNLLKRLWQRREDTPRVSSLWN